jgi:hypothetical protein
MKEFAYNISDALKVGLRPDWKVRLLPKPLGLIRCLNMRPEVEGLSSRNMLIDPFEVIGTDSSGNPIALGAILNGGVTSYIDNNNDTIYVGGVNSGGIGSGFGGGGASGKGASQDAGSYFGYDTGDPGYDPKNYGDEDGDSLNSSPWTSPKDVDSHNNTPGNKTNINDPSGANIILGSNYESRINTPSVIVGSGRLPSMLQVTGGSWTGNAYMRGMTYYAPPPAINYMPLTPFYNQGWLGNSSCFTTPIGGNSAGTAVFALNSALISGYSYVVRYGAQVIAVAKSNNCRVSVYFSKIGGGVWHDTLTPDLLGTYWNSIPNGPAPAHLPNYYFPQLYYTTRNYNIVPTVPTVNLDYLAVNDLRSDTTHESIILTDMKVYLNDGSIPAGVTAGVLTQYRAQMNNPNPSGILTMWAICVIKPLQPLATGTMKGRMYIGGSSFDSVDFVLDPTKGIQIFGRAIYPVSGIIQVQLELCVPSGTYNAGLPYAEVASLGVYAWVL